MQVLFFNTFSVRHHGALLPGPFNFPWAMAPLVIAQDPDLTDSEEEKKYIQNSTESVQEENKQLNILPSSAASSSEIVVSESSAHHSSRLLPKM